MFHNKKLRIAAVLIFLLIGLLVLAGNTVQVRENPTFLEKDYVLQPARFKMGFMQ